MFDSILQIPNVAGWPERSLAKMCSTITRGTAPVYVEHSDVFAIGQRCVSSTGFVSSFARPHSPRATRNVLKPEIGDVLLNSTGTGTIGRSCVFDAQGSFIVDGHVTLLRPVEGQFRGEWLNAVFRTDWGQRHLERFCYSGSTNQIELNRSQLSSTSLPVPRIDEQNLFAEIFATLDSAIQQTEAIVEKLKQVKQGLLHDLLTRGIDANGELRPSYEQTPHLYKESPLGWIPKEWSSMLLGDALIGIDAGWSPNCPEEPPRVGEWGVLKVSAVSGGKFQPNESKRLPMGLRPDSSIEVCDGDVLLTRANGVADLVATTVFVETTPRRLMLSDKTLRLNPLPQLLSSRILAAFMSHPLIRKQIGGMLNGSSGQKNISQEQIRQLQIAIPPLTEQKLAEVVIQKAESRIYAEQIQLSKWKSEKSGLMDDLLTGRVRVTPLLAQPQ
jgi:type I restriction enzyme S subunit